MKNSEDYKEGMKDAWNLAAKIVKIGEYDLKWNIFAKLRDGELPFEKYSAEEAAALIKEYEAVKNIKVGDEVVCGNVRGLILKHDGTSIEGFTSDMHPFKWRVGDCEKTGRFFGQAEAMIKDFTDTPAPVYDPDLDEENER